MARFKRLTAAEASTLTRSQLLDRIEAEQTYWYRKRNPTPEEEAGEREFHRIMHAALNPADGIGDSLRYLQGVPGAGRYFDECPDISDAPARGQAGG